MEDTKNGTSLFDTWNAESYGQGNGRTYRLFKQKTHNRAHLYENKKGERIVYIKDESKYIDEDTKILMLKKVKNILEKHDIDYWIEFGTLLGYVREKKFIPWDSDIDIATCMGKEVKSLKEEFEKNNLTFHKRYEKMKNKTTIFKIREKDAPRDKSIHVDIYCFDGSKNEYIWLHQTGKNIVRKTAHNLYLVIEDFDHVKTTKARELLKKMTKSICGEKSLRCLEALETLSSKRQTFIFDRKDAKEVIFYSMKIKIPSDPENHLLLLYGKNWRIPSKEYIHGGEYKKSTGGKTICRLS